MTVRACSMKAVSLALVAAAAVSCGATTSLSDSWANPEVKPPVTFTRIATLAISKDAARRRMVEDAMAAELNEKGAKAVPSYTLITAEGELKDRDAVKQKLAAAGVDGVVMMRSLGVDKEATYVPGTTTYAPYYGSPWGYYGHWSGVMYDPGYVAIDENVKIETVIYSLTQDKMVYAGRSETLNPGNSVDLVNGVGKAVVKDMEKKGLLMAKK
jgi:hypothetical protein